MRPEPWWAERADAYARARALGNALMGGLAVALPALVVLAWLAWA